MGPTWVLSAPVGPHVGPLTLAIRAGLLSYALQWPCLWLMYFLHSANHPVNHVCWNASTHGISCGTGSCAISVELNNLAILASDHCVFACVALCHGKLPTLLYFVTVHDDAIKWKHFPRYWPFVREIHRSPMNSPQKASDLELWCILWSAPE